MAFRRRKQPAAGFNESVGSDGRPIAAAILREAIVKSRAIVIVTCILLTCILGGAEAKKTMKKEPFGKTEDGQPVDLYTLSNKNGMEAAITNFGGIVVSLKVADRSGKVDDVVLGYDNLDGYLKVTPYFGAIIGRYGNRIARGKFDLNGTTYTLVTNNGPNALHGGTKGFDKVVWAPKLLARPDGPALELSYVSKDGEEGYPGTLSVTATYSLSGDNGLRLGLRATTDKETVINLTQHSYFNLAGKGDILNHEVVRTSLVG